VLVELCEKGDHAQSVVNVAESIYKSRVSVFDDVDQRIGGLVLDVGFGELYFTTT
jgi:hypothetical protein